MIISGLASQNTIICNKYCNVMESSFLVGTVLTITGAALSCFLERRRHHHNLDTPRTWVVCGKGTLAIGIFITLTSITSLFIYVNRSLSTQVK